MKKQKKTSTRKAPENKSASEGQETKELSEHDLDQVAGGSVGALPIDAVSSIENPTTIGSGTSGAGAGKIKFNEFQITKTTDKSSPTF
jgi:hypothetical protein